MGNKGQTYDELLQKMTIAYREKKLRKELRKQGVSEEAIEQIIESEKDLEKDKYKAWKEAKEEL